MVKLFDCCMAVRRIAEQLSHQTIKQSLRPQLSIRLKRASVYIAQMHYEAPQWKHSSSTDNVPQEMGALGQHMGKWVGGVLIAIEHPKQKRNVEQQNG